MALITIASPKTPNTNKKIVNTWHFLWWQGNNLHQKAMTITVKSWDNTHVLPIAIFFNVIVAKNIIWCVDDIASSYESPQRRSSPEEHDQGLAHSFCIYHIEKETASKTVFFILNSGIFLRKDGNYFLERWYLFFWKTVKIAFFLANVNYHLWTFLTCMVEPFLKLQKLHLRSRRVLITAIKNLHCMSRNQIRIESDRNDFWESNRHSFLKQIREVLEQNLNSWPDGKILKVYV